VDGGHGSTPRPPPPIYQPLPSYENGDQPSTYMRFNAAIRTSFWASASYCIRQSILPVAAKGAALGACPPRLRLLPLPPRTPFVWCCLVRRPLPPAAPCTAPGPAYLAVEAPVLVWWWWWGGVWGVGGESLSGLRRNLIWSSVRSSSTHTAKQRRARGLTTRRRDDLSHNFSSASLIHRREQENDDDKPKEHRQAIVPPRNLLHHVAAARPAAFRARVAAGTARGQAGRLLCTDFGGSKPSPRHVLLCLDAAVVGSRDGVHPPKRGGLEVVCMRPDRVRLGPPGACADLRLPRHYSKGAHRLF
jgi:hypothetical protein